MGSLKVKSGSADKGRQPYDAMVYQDGTYTVAVDSEGNLIKKVLTSANTDDVVIQAAIDYGGKIFLSGDFNVDAGLTLFSITSIYGTSAKIRMNDNVDESVINITSPISDVVIDGLEIDGNGNNQTFSVQFCISFGMFFSPPGVAETTNVTIKNCVLYNGKRGGIGGSYGWEPVVNLMCSNNEIYNCAKGINFDRGYCVANGNYIHDITEEAILVEKGNHIHCYDNYIDTCHIGIYLTNVTRTDIRNNIIIDAYYRGISGVSSTARVIQIVGNVIESVGSRHTNAVGIFNVGSNLIVENNEIINYYNGITTSNSYENAVVCKNKVHDCNYSFVMYSPNSIVYENISIASGTKSVAGGAVGILFRNNTFDKIPDISNMTNVKMQLNNYVHISEIRDHIDTALEKLGTPRLLSPFAEVTGTSITDYTRSANTLTASASVATIYGFQGRATYYDLNGTSHYLYRADDTDFDFGNAATDDAFSIVCCVNPDDVTSRQIIGKWDDNNQREWRLFFDASGYPTFQLYDESADTYIGRQDQTAFTTGSWQVLVATYDGSGINAGCKIYIDGVQLDDADYDNGVYVAMEAVTANLMVGALKNAAAYSEYYDGKMTWIGVAAKELSADEVWSLTQRLKGVLGI